MGLNAVVGYTDDGAVFLRFDGQQQSGGQPLQTVITIEPDMAAGLAKKLAHAADKAMEANKRSLVLGEPITYPRGK